MLNEFTLWPFTLELKCYALFHITRFGHLGTHYCRMAIRNTAFTYGLTFEKFYSASRYTCINLLKKMYIVSGLVSTKFTAPLRKKAKMLLPTLSV